MATGGEQRLDYFVAQDRDCGHRPEAHGRCLVSAAVSCFADEILAAQFPQILCRLSGRVRCCCRAVQSPYFPGQIGSGESFGGT